MQTLVLGIDNGNYSGKYGFEYIHKNSIEGIYRKHCLDYSNLTLPVDFAYQMTPFQTWIHAHFNKVFSDNPERIEAKPSDTKVVFRTAAVSIVPESDHQTKWKLADIKDNYSPGAANYRLVRNMEMSFQVEGEEPRSFHLSEGCQPVPDKLDFGAKGVFDLFGRC